MAYAKTQKGAQARVTIKRQLRKLGVKGWRNNSSTSKLKSLLSRKKR